MVLFHLQMVMFQTTQKGDGGFGDYWQSKDFRAGTSFAGIHFCGRRRTGRLLRQSGRLGNGKRYTTYDEVTWLSYVHTALRYFPREHPNLFPDPAFVYAENYGMKSAEDFCALIDFYVFGIGRNYTPTNEEIRIGGRLLKHEVGGIFDAPFCNWFPIYLIDLPDGIRRIIPRDRRQSDTLHECRLPRTENGYDMKVISGVSIEKQRESFERFRNIVEIALEKHKRKGT